jgi:hypothetical protein
MGTDETDLSTLAGARVGTVGATLRTRRQETELQPLETGTSGGATAYLKVEKPRFLSLEGSTGAVVAPFATAAVLPDAFVVHAGASAARAASSMIRPATGASVPTVGVLDWQTYQGGTRGSRLCGEDRDRETENSKVCAKTRDTRFIQVRATTVASPTSCLGDQVWCPVLGVG